MAVPKSQKLGVKGWHCAGKSDYTIATQVTSSLHLSYCN